MVIDSDIEVTNVCSILFICNGSMLSGKEGLRLAITQLDATHDVSYRLLDEL